jgi:hypothetical protein
MRLQFLAVFGIVVIATASWPARAASVYQWCARARLSEVGALSCGFSNREQCLASLAGYAGNCVENPAYEVLRGQCRRHQNVLSFRRVSFEKRVVATLLKKHC